MATNEFERVVRAHRRRQLVWTRDSVQKLDGILRRAAIETAERLKHYAGDSVLTREYLAALLADLNRILGDLAADFSGMLPLFLAGVAQISADREAGLARAALTDAVLQAALSGLLPETRRSMQIRGVGELSVEFGRVAEHAVNVTYQRVYKDGLTLSDRIWRFDQDVRRDLEDKVVQAVAQQKSARELARDIRGYLRDSEGANARYNAMRLARTELSTAGREGHIQSAVNADGSLKGHISALGWRLSASHVRPDVCDMWASQDLHSLGAGNYPPDAVPVDHPHGLCYTVSILKDRPGLQFVAKEPDPGGATPVLRPPAFWREQVAAYQEPRLAQAASVRDMTKASYKAAVTKHVRSLMESGRIATSIDGPELLSVVRDGRFKNQFETGTSRGFLDPSVRQRAELSLFGIPSDVSGDRRPIYGHVLAETSDRLGRESQYGDCTVIFRKDRVSQRTTVTFGDSLDRTRGGVLPTLLPTRFTRPDYRMADYGVDADPLDFPSLDRLAQERRSDVPYVEAQITPPVTTADIEEVLVPRGAGYNDLRSVLDSKGIPWRYRR